jgi:hypothetical protein
MVSRNLVQYSRTFLIHAIWGDVPGTELAKYRKKIFDRFRKSNWTRLELEKIKVFLESEKKRINSLT